MPYYRCNSVGSKTMNFTQRTGYAYYGSQGNVAESYVTLKNNGWKSIRATDKSNVQYASVYSVADDGTETRLILDCTDEDVDISSVTTLKLYLRILNKSSITQSSYAQTTWELE